MKISNQLKSFEDELRRKAYRENSIQNYLSYVSVFLKEFKEKDSLKHISEQDIKSFLSKFKEQNTQRAYHSAIKAFYKYVVRQPNKFKYIEYAKRNRKLPVILSVEEMQRLIDVCDNLKHKAIICLMYSTGIRVSEVINLRFGNLDFDRKIIMIENAKGGKDRMVNLDSSFAEILTKYISIYKPKDYVFEGQVKERYTERSIGNFLKKYSELVGLKKRIYPHLIRHTSLTHLAENKTDINIIQRLAGHASQKTTNLYLHLSHTFISQIQSPLQSIRFQ